MDGLFMGNGPYRVNRDLSLNITMTGWQEHATMVFGKELHGIRLYAGVLIYLYSGSTSRHRL